MSEETANTEEKLPEKPVPAGGTSKFLIKYTMDGEVLYEQLDKGHREFPLKTVDLLPLPEGLKPAHIREMAQFHALLNLIKRRHPDRLIPVTRVEFKQLGVDMRRVKQLIKWGYMKEILMPVLKDGKPSGARNCLFYTPQGRALIRDKVDPQYAITNYK